MDEDTELVERRRLDSMARNRASADLKAAHEEQWRSLFEGHLRLLRAEQAVAGQVPRSRNPVLHRDDGHGACVECGERVPCERQRKRERARARRVRAAAPPALGD